jgi:hypothetical protein
MGGVSALSKKSFEFSVFGFQFSVLPRRPGRAFVRLATQTASEN